MHATCATNAVVVKPGDPPVSVAENIGKVALRVKGNTL